MADGSRDGKRTARWRERAAVAAMVFFPLLVGAGFLAPGWVHVLAVAQTGIAAQETEPLEDQVGPFARRPLPAPRIFFGGKQPELLDLEPVFVVPWGGEHRSGAGSAALIERLASFPRNDGDFIVIHDVGTVTPEVVFKDALTEEYDEPVVGVDEEFGIFPLCSVIPFGNCVRFDDLTDSEVPSDDPAVVPEPATGLLLGLGLLGMASYRRRRLA
ncbi:MAG: PEP-CTERM sorting domain-containing protein [Myxococcota bacterium]|nr:PEP-CTERM sorting domain-containing protein [Myxococcota bacterium]